MSHPVRHMAKRTKINFKINMHINLLNDTSAVFFTKELMEIGNEKMVIDEFTHRITLPTNFCKIITTTGELIHKVYENILRNYKS